MTITFKRSILDSDRSPCILWDNLLDGSVITTSSGNGNNLVDYATNTFWSPTSLAATITFDLGSLKGASYLGICSHNLQSSGCGFILQTSNDGGATWVDVFFDAPTSNSAIFFPFAYTESRYWRLSIYGDTPPSMGVAFLGQSIQFETGILPGYTPLYMAEDIELMTAQTITGQFMPNRIQRRGLSTSFNLNILDKEFIEGDDFQAFRRYFNDGGSFFFASNPYDLRDDISYCWRKGNTIQPTLQDTGLFYSTQIGLEAFLD